MIQHMAVDPELLEPLNAFMEMMGGEVNLDDIEATRAQSEEFFAAILAEAPVIEGVESRDLQVPGSDGDPDVVVRIYRLVAQVQASPALLWIHGGGYVLGDIDSTDLVVRQLVADTGCVVASVDYRLAPENPYPAPLEDCYAALRYLFDQAGVLQVDSTRIAVGGASAGGGLAAGLALLARDRGEFDIAFQLLIYPMLDDRNVQPASEQRPDTLLWTRKNNLIGWRSYLDQELGTGDVSPYAAAFRADDLSGLPPAFIPVGDLDLFLDENIEYARRLIAAGVRTQLNVYPGAYHAFDTFAPMAALSRQLLADRNNALVRALFD